jgi:hypothetical protein
LKTTTWSRSSRRTLPTRFDAEGPHRGDDLGGERRVTVEDEVSDSGDERERLAELLDDPRCCGMVGNVEPKDASSAMVDCEPDVQDPKGRRRDHEEVHRGDHIAMVAQEHKPARHGVGTEWTTRQVPRDGALGYVEAEHEQLAVDPWRSPDRILRHHPADQVADAPVYWWPPRSPASTREPSPVEPEAR